MSITVTNAQIINSMPVIGDLLKISLPAATAFKIGRIVKKLTDTVKLYENTKVDLARRYADKDESGELVFKDGKVFFEQNPNNAALFVAEMTALDAVSVNVDVAKLHEADFAGVQLQSNVLLVLDWMIDIG